MPSKNNDRLHLFLFSALKTCFTRWLNSNRAEEMEKEWRRFHLDNQEYC